jgi:hypothetical protein
LYGRISCACYQGTSTAYASCLKNYPQSALALNTVLAVSKLFELFMIFFRNFREGFDDFVMETACGLRNWRLDSCLTI